MSTALSIITTSFNILNVFQPGDSIPAADSSFAFTLLNAMMDQWALQTGTIPVTSREVFPLVANKGGTTNPYTIGPGGDFNAAQSPSVDDITGAGMLLNTSTPPVEVPRALYDDDAYAAIRIKDLASTLFTGVYYNPTFANGRGTISLWPVPSTAINSLVLYRQQYLGQFVSLAAAYDLPRGYDKALADNLVLELADPYGRPLTASLERKAVLSLAVIKRANAKMSDLGVDPMFTQSGKGRGGYNIITGSGG